MARKAERPFTDYEGNQRVRRFQTRYWLGNRNHKPSSYARGFPKTEDGSIAGVGKLALRGWISKAQCFDWLTGKVLWTVERGAKVPGTNIYSVTVHKGDHDGN